MAPDDAEQTPIACAAAAASVQRARGLSGSLDRRRSSCSRLCKSRALRAATVAIGVAYTAGALALLGWRVSESAQLLRAEEAGVRARGVPPAFQAALLGAQVLFSLLLVAGACAGRPLLVKAWLVFSVSAALLAAAVAVVRAAVLGAERGRAGDALPLLVAAVVGLGVSFMFFAVVNAFHEEMLRARRERLLGP